MRPARPHQFRHEVNLVSPLQGVHQLDQHLLHQGIGALSHCPRKEGAGYQGTVNPVFIPGHGFHCVSHHGEGTFAIGRRHGEVDLIRQGGLEAFALDIDIPLKYGIDQCVSDTLSAGGIMYAHIKERMPTAHAATAMTGVNFFTMMGVVAFLQGLGSVMHYCYPQASLGASAFKSAFWICAACLGLTVGLYAFTIETRRWREADP